MRIVQTQLAVVAFILLSLAAAAHPTMAGRVKSFSGQRLTLQLKDNSTRTFVVTQGSSLLRPGANVSVEVVGSLSDSKPMKAGKIVAWGNSSEIVAKGAKAPYYTAVGDYATTAGSDGVPNGAPVGAHGLTNILGTVGHGGSGNMPTVSTTPGSVSPSGASTLGVPTGSVQYRNQGEAQAGPLEMMQISP